MNVNLKTKTGKLLVDKMDKSVSKYFKLVNHVYGKTLEIGDLFDLFVLKSCRHFLSLKLKSMCYLNGREKSGKECAAVMHNLARVQSRIGDELHKLQHLDRLKNLSKIAWVRSAGLFNAAIVRNPQNVAEIKSDLDDFCGKILRYAKSDDHSVNLRLRGKSLQQDFIEFRKIVEEGLSQEKMPEAKNERIKVVRDLLGSISEFISTKMRDLMKFCIGILVKLPCKYALVGMGSLARKEVTPYSDFENIIVLEDGIEALANYEEILDYFRWAALIFQIVTVNVGETILRFMAIPGLNCTFNKEENWFYDENTPCGFSLDGMHYNACKNALGRQELLPDKPWKTEFIKPVREMLRYLGRKEDIKNGFNIAHIFMECCFVCGDDEIYQEYEKGVKKFHRRLKEETEMSEGKRPLLQHIQDNIDEFSAFYEMVSSIWSMQIDVKRLLYRTTTIFVSALGRYHQIESDSCFEIVNALKNLPENFKEDLTFAVAIASETRLRNYGTEKQQQDYKATYNFDEGSDGFLGNVGNRVESTIAEHLSSENLLVYVKAALYLQSLVMVTLNLRPMSDSDSPAAKLKNLARTEGSYDNPYYKVLTHIMLGIGDQLIEMLENDPNYAEMEKSTKLYFQALGAFAKLDFEAARRFFTEANQLAEPTCTQTIYMHAMLALCNCRTFRYEDSIKECDYTISKVKESEKKHPMTLLIAYYVKAACCFIQADHQRAIECFDLASNLAVQVGCSFPGAKQTLPENEHKETRLSQQIRIDCLSMSARSCAITPGFFSSVRGRLLRELALRRKITTCEPKDPDIAQCIFRIGFCDFLEGKPERATKLYHKASEMFRANGNKMWQKQTAYMEMSVVLMELANYCDSNSTTRESITRVVQLTENIDSALNQFQESDTEFTEPEIKDQIKSCQPFLLHKILQQQDRELFKDQENALSTFMSLMSVPLPTGLLALARKEYTKALATFKIFQVVSAMMDMKLSNDEFAVCLNGIGKCLMHLGEHEIALKYFQKELENRNIFSTESGLEKAACHSEIGTCHKVLKQHKEALFHFGSATKIRREVGEKAEKKEKADGVNLEAKVMFNEKKLDDALEFYKKELQLREELGQHDKLSSCFLNIGVCYFNLYDFHDARKAFENAENCAEPNSAECHKWIGKCDFEEGRIAEALQRFEHELAERKTLSVESDYAECCFNIAKCYEKCFYIEKGADYFKMAQIYWETSGDPCWDENIAACETAIVRCQSMFD